MHAHEVPVLVDDGAGVAREVVLLRAVEERVGGEDAVVPLGGLVPLVTARRGRGEPGGQQEHGEDPRPGAHQCGRWRSAVSNVNPVAGSIDTALPVRPP